ncbi:MAG TPA: hypothetical protein V6D27_10505 [Vampirovibrionales bacterium]
MKDLQHHFTIWVFRLAAIACSGVGSGSEGGDRYTDSALKGDRLGSFPGFWLL